VGAVGLHDQVRVVNLANVIPKIALRSNPTPVSLPTPSKYLPAVDAQIDGEIDRIEGKVELVVHHPLQKIPLPAHGRRLSSKTLFKADNRCSLFVRSKERPNSQPA
jgi:hypothetical protein